MLKLMRIEFVQWKITWSMRIRYAYTIQEVTRVTNSHYCCHMTKFFNHMMVVTQLLEGKYMGMVETGQFFLVVNMSPLRKVKNSYTTVVGSSCHSCCDKLETHSQLANNAVSYLVASADHNKCRM